MFEPPAPHPVVVCWRGASCQSALQLGLVLARALRQPLILATAYRYEPAGLTADQTTQVQNQARADAADEALRAVLDDIDHDVEVRPREVPALDVPDALAQLAVETDASMLVVARDRARHSIARKTIQHAPCPVAVADPDAPVTVPARIGVACDDSDASRTAIRLARRIAARCGGRVRLLCVDADCGPWPTLVESGAALAVDTEPLHLHGDPARVLAEAADEVDLLVCGTHQRGRIAAALLGSVSGELVRLTDGHVLVVPAPTRRRAATPLGVTTALG